MKRVKALRPLCVADCTQQEGRGEKVIEQGMI